MDHQITVAELADRQPLFVERSAGRSVLHVGCCDVPVFDPDNNLHLVLARHTDRLDGLDVSDEGIAVLRRYVGGEYYTSPSAVPRQYDLVLAPEVLEHTTNAFDFLTGLFSIRAAQYLVTAPHFEWFKEARREGTVFHERVHPDHKAWYSPYTLLRALQPFIVPDADDVEVFHFAATGSVGVAVTKPFVPAPFAGRRADVAADVDSALAAARASEAARDPAGALRALEAARARFEDSRLVQAELRLLLDGGQKIEALRRGVAWLRVHPDDGACLALCADVAVALGRVDLAEKWRAAARSRG